MGVDALEGSLDNSVDWCGYMVDDEWPLLLEEAVVADNEARGVTVAFFLFFEPSKGIVPVMMCKRGKR